MIRIGLGARLLGLFSVRGGGGLFQRGHRSRTRRLGRNGWRRGRDADWGRFRRGLCATADQRQQEQRAEISMIHEATPDLAPPLGLVNRYSVYFNRTAPSPAVTRAG